MAMFRVLAKIHELLIVSSLSTIIFSVIRVQLLYGTGVPLGLLCSGFNFPQITYFWSEEYWGSMKAPIPRRTLIPFALLLSTAGLVAVAAVPASAILTSPRMQDWVAGTTSFYVRGLADDLHPSRVVGSESTMNALCLNTSAINLSTCPSSGFSSLTAYAINQQTIKNGDSLRHPGLFCHWTVSGNVRGLACQTSVLAPWIPITMYQNPIYGDRLQTIDSLDWTLKYVNVAEYKYKSGQSVSIRAKIPVVRTACSQAQNVSSGETAVNLPILPEYSCWADGNIGGQAGHVPTVTPNHQASKSKPWDDSWLAALSPPLNEPSTPLASNLSSMTTFETILHSSALIDTPACLTTATDPAALWDSIVPGAPNRTLFLEWLTAVLVSVTGYPNTARPDFHARILRGANTLNPPSGFDSTTFTAAITIQGLSYQARLATDYLSIAVLLVHAVLAQALAQAHIVYVLRARRSSVAWGTVTELVVLAYNSRPVAAGIECLEAYRRVVVVRAARVVGSAGSITGRGGLDSGHKQAELILLQDH
ncbi:uncharacterized protein GGS25DRAFT_517157 [Hypoxylon fragiforme]|uniref:uncharacterized protein n=1 Tax=Hypoxylon fragiforme TaxID=63214 RepID=UPI0020C67AD1|nr:uncharacterized protein GGS25DRAFT_517157 [Hypoxylon fragiforme]KAI2614310.1 hypothetical protein GGS25DRAFT_517157 [Hypoxylon fragiforme]